MLKQIWENIRIKTASIFKTFIGYFKGNYSKLLWTAIITFISVFVSVNYANQKSIDRQQQIEVDFVKNRLVVLLFETSHDLTLVKNLRKDYSFTIENGVAKAKVSDKLLESSVASLLLSDPLTPKYCGQGLIYATSSMVDAIDTFNNNSKYVRQMPMSKESYQIIQDSLVQVEYKILCVQWILDRYNEGYKLRKEINYDEIWKMISGEKDYKKEMPKIKKLIENR